MIFDTDIFIWVQRGNSKAARLMEVQVERYLSVVTFLELLQSAKNKEQHRVTKRFMVEFEMNVLPLSENIGHRALIYMEEYGLACGLQSADALIAATAKENGMPLLSSNAKHFRAIHDLDLRVFKP